jgi:hypothetical protein
MMSLAIRSSYLNWKIGIAEWWNVGSCGVKKQDLGQPLFQYSIIPKNLIVIIL